MLALHGFDAYGLEISETAIKEARAYAAAELDNPSAYHFSGDTNLPDSAGSVTFFQGDFFSSKWDFQEGIEETTRFDIAYDYTVSRCIFIM